MQYSVNIVEFREYSENFPLSEYQMQQVNHFPSSIKQEQLSRYQLSERLTQIDWIPSTPSVDLGEDFIVHIQLDGRPTGLTFHIQEKSVTDLLARRRGNHLIYDLEVRHLLRWEKFGLPVVLIVWDVILKEGRWALITDLISDLDSRRPSWRNNKTKARVHIPWENSTDDKGLSRLRHKLGFYYFPLISKNKPFEWQMTLDFPDSKEGKEASEKWDNYIKHGDPVKVIAPHVDGISFIDWFEKWFGDLWHPQKGEIEFGLLNSSNSYPVSVTIINEYGIHSLDNMQMKIIKGGTESITLSSEPNTHLVSLHFIFSRHESKFNFDTDFQGQEVHQVYEITKFLYALKTGGTFQLKFPTIKDTTWEYKLPPQADLNFNKSYLELLKQLCKIQARTHESLKLPDYKLDSSDIVAIHKISDIIECGKSTESNGVLSLQAKTKAIDIILDKHTPGKSHTITAYSEESPPINLFDKEFDMGPVSLHVTGQLQTPLEQLKEASHTLSPEETFTIKFIDCETIEIFPDWFRREAKRVSKLLLEKFDIDAIYLFGSLAWGKRFAPNTDIDLAVTGFSGGHYLDAISFLTRSSEFPIDLVVLDTLPDRLQQRILSEGVLLGESKRLIMAG